MKLRSKQFWLDTAERVGWTFVQAVLSFLTVEAFDLPKEWVPVGTAVLSFLKAQVARHVGAKDTASTLSARSDPAAPPANPPAGG